MGTKKTGNDITNSHIYRVGSSEGSFDSIPDEKEKEALRKKIEPWLSAVFQSEHLSLLVGNGLTVGVASLLGEKACDMATIKFDGDFTLIIENAAKAIAVKAGRGEANFEDSLRIASELIRGLEILSDNRTEALKKQINTKLSDFIKAVLETENSITEAFDDDNEKSQIAINSLISFLLSFASRVSSRERLNLFTTNYDRLIEHGCDLAGLRIVDRFVGLLTPIFRASRLNIDIHYNPPGIRGEPRYLEGVVRLFKLHGSLDWRAEGKEIKRYNIPFGAPDTHPGIPTDPLDNVLIYPNSTKDMETSLYPYAELFRDFASAICRPNSSLVTYGYGYGDDHINRIIRDMLTIPSTHLVIISFNDPGNRIDQFCKYVGHEAQISLMVGSHFGNLYDLVNNYLPKPAIDLITIRKADLLKRREIVNTNQPNEGTSSAGVILGGLDDTNTD